MTTLTNAELAEIEAVYEYAREDAPTKRLLRHIHAQDEKLRRVAKGIQAVNDLIADSEGVYGLHRNGDPAPWSELQTGGRFEEWLVDFDAAVIELAYTALNGEKQT